MFNINFSSIYFRRKTFSKYKCFREKIGKGFQFLSAIVNLLDVRVKQNTNKKLRLNYVKNIGYRKIKIPKIPRVFLITKDSLQSKAKTKN